MVGAGEERDEVAELIRGSRKAMKEEQGREFGRSGGDVGNGGVWGDGEVIVGGWVRLGGCGSHFICCCSSVLCELRVDCLEEYMII